MKHFKWPVAVLAFVLTLAVSVGAVHLRQRQMVNEPLFKRIGDLENVQKVELKREGSTQIVYVTLDYVGDLSATYRELNDEISRLLGQNRYRLELLDGRDQALEAAFLAVHLALYEGEHRGNFTEMGYKVANILAALQIEEHKVTVDSNNIYIQIKNDDAYLYEIISRENRGRDGEHA